MSRSASRTKPGTGIAIRACARSRVREKVFCLACGTPVDCLRTDRRIENRVPGIGHCQEVSAFASTAPAFSVSYAGHACCAKRRRICGSASDAICTSISARSNLPSTASGSTSSVHVQIKPIELHHAPVTIALHVQAFLELIFGCECRRRNRLINVGKRGRIVPQQTGTLNAAIALSGRRSPVTSMAKTLTAAGPK